MTSSPKSGVHPASKVPKIVNLGKGLALPFRVAQTSPPKARSRHSGGLNS